MPDHTDPAAPVSATTAPGAQPPAGTHVDAERLQLLYRISRELNSPEPGEGLDLVSLMPRILSTTARHTGSDNASIIVLDESGAPVNAWVWTEGAIGKFSLDMMAQVLSEGLAGWALRERRGAFIRDTSMDARWLSLPELPWTSRPGSAICLPLLLPERVAGVLTLYFPAPEHFDVDDYELISAVADQITMAVEHARLFAAERQRRRVADVLQATASDLVSTLDLPEILQQLMQRVVSVLEVEAGSVGLIDAQRNEIVFEIAAGGGAAAVQGMRLRLGQGIGGWVAQTGECAVVPDVHGDRRWYDAADRASGVQTRALLAVPIEVHGRRLGVIEAINPVGNTTFTDQHLQLLRALAGLAGSAIANAQAFAGLQAAEDRYAALFEDSIDPILITNMSGTITEANRKACDFLGFERDDLIGMNINLVHRMGSGLLGEQRLAHVQSGAELIFKTRAWTKRGQEAPVEVHAARIRRSGQQFLQWVEHDVTEREQLEEMREDLLAMVFHDLRAPLGNVLSSLEMLEAALPRDEGNAVLASLVDIALRSSQRLSHLLNSLLDLRRLESGQAILDKEPADLALIAREALDQVQPSADSRSVTLSAAIPARVPLLLLDIDMLRRVLINLLDNAVKYTPPGRRVQLRVSTPDPQTVLVEVVDEGTGIAREHQSLIFEKFSRIHREGGPKGLGLGLAFCRLAVEAHGGRIWVDSTPGKGSNFQFTLPV
jgi:NtrC-family two-component system sensor histidine kinase KinB